MNTIRAMLRHGTETEGRNVSFSSIGYKGYHFLKRRSMEVEHFYENAAALPSWETAKSVGSTLANTFISGTSHEVWIAYSKRASNFSEEPVVRRLLPLDLSHKVPVVNSDYLFEDTRERIIEQTVLLLVQSIVYEAMLDSAVAEHAARMSAMDNASSNCDRLLGQYIQLRNRARQAVITTELNEIVTGKEALES
jgi:F-type H+-transporting ATPase subunit gamma